MTDQTHDQDYLYSAEKAEFEPGLRLEIFYVKAPRRGRPGEEEVRTYQRKTSPGTLTVPDWEDRTQADETRHITRFSKEYMYLEDLFRLHYEGERGRTVAANDTASALAYSLPKKGSGELELVIRMFDGTETKISAIITKQDRVIENLSWQKEKLIQDVGREDL